MLGDYKDRHVAMWQYIIDHVDDILKYYADTKEEEEDPEWIILDMKHTFILRAYKECDIYNMCYACEQCSGVCSKCPVVSKAGNCRNEDDAAYNMVLKAIINNDKEMFIDEARRLKDAWK